MSYIYKVSQEINNDYDTYDSFICVAESSEQAQCIHPRNESSYYNLSWYEDEWYDGEQRDHPYYNTDWTTPDNVKVEVIGETVYPHIEPGTIILTSFNAG